MEDTDQDELVTLTKSIQSILAAHQINAPVLALDPRNIDQAKSFLNVFNAINRFSH
jgi:hypothetical protein